MDMRNPGKLGLLLVVVIAVVAMAVTGALNAATVGQELGNLTIRDANDKPATLPHFGTKLISIFYNDADAADINDPLADAIKAKKFSAEKYKGMGIANLKDSKAPNFLIRRIVQGKIRKYNTTILLDPDRIVSTKWGLGDCNNTSVFLLIGKDRKIKYIKKGAVRGAEIQKVIKLIETLAR